MTSSTIKFSGPVGFVEVLAYVILASFLWHLITYRFADTSKFAQAMAFIWP